MYGGRAGGAEGAGGEGERPAGDDLVVDEQHLGARRAVGWASGSGRQAKRRETAATRWAEFIAPRPGGTEASTIAKRPTTGTWR